MQRKHPSKSHAALRRKTAKKKEVINQPVTIRNILLYSDKTESCRLVISDTVTDHVPPGSYLLIKEGPVWQLFHSKITSHGELLLNPIHLKNMPRLKSKLYSFPLEMKIDALKEDDIVSIKKIISGYRQDIHTLQDYAYGEAYSSSTKSGDPHIHASLYSDIQVVERLIDQIQLIANIANAIHEKSNDAEKNKKENKLNSITRVATVEFYLYTSEPLTIEQYEQVIKNTEKIARQCHVNVHLLLSSIAVLVNDKILNMSLYVQCGHDPKINALCKSNPAKEDVTYPHYGNFSLREQREENDPFSCYIASDKAHAITIPTNNVFVVETEGGARYIQAIDICQESDSEKSIKLIRWSIICEGGFGSDILPQQSNQILTSNAIEEKKSARITDSFVHVDPVHPRSRPFYHLEHSINDSGFIDLTELKGKYRLMEIDVTKGVIKIINPPFGSDISMLVFPEKPIDHLSKNLSEQIEGRNQHLEYSLFKRHLDERHDDIEEYKKIMENNKYLAQQSAREFHQFLSLLINEFSANAASLTRYFYKNPKKMLRDCLTAARDHLANALKENIEDTETAIKILTQISSELIENLDDLITKNNFELNEMIKMLVPRIENQFNLILSVMNPSPQASCTNNQEENHPTL